MLLLSAVESSSTEVGELVVCAREAPEGYF